MVAASVNTHKIKKPLVPKSLRVNCWETDQVTSKCQMDLDIWSKMEKVNTTIEF